MKTDPSGAAATSTILQPFSSSSVLGAVGIDEFPSYILILGDETATMVDKADELDRLIAFACLLDSRNEVFVNCPGTLVSVCTVV